MIEIIRGRARSATCRRSNELKILNDYFPHFVIKIKFDAKYLWFRLKFTLTCLRRVEIVEIIHRTVKLIFVYSFAQVGGIHGVIGEGLFI